MEVVEKGWTLVNGQAQGCSGLNNLTSTTGTQRGLRGTLSMAATNATNDASESGLTDKYETTDDLLMFMTVFFVVLIVLFIGFCAYYMQFNWDTVEDIMMIRTRQRQRSANQVRCLFHLNISGCACYKYLYSRCL